METKLRDAEAIKLQRRGLTYDEIADQLGYSNRGSAFRAVQRGLRDYVMDDNPLAVMVELERLTEAMGTAFAIMREDHIHVASNGTIPVGIDAAGKEHPILDRAPNLQAALAVKAISESIRKLRGLDAPARRQVEVITQTALDDEILRLAAEVAQNDGRDVAEVLREVGVDAAAGHRGDT